MNQEQELRKIVEELDIKLVEILEETSYWLIRTYGGKYYDTFHSNNFIGVGWDWEKELCETANITPSDREYLHAVKQFKRSNYYSQIISNFIENLQIGDIVICPAYRSNKVLLGNITSEVIFSNDEFPYARKRQVEWIKEISWTEIPPSMYRFLSTQHGMCSAQTISNEINRIMYPFYIVGNKAYLTLKVQTQKAISLKTINELLTFLSENIMQNNFVSLKTELSSPGFLQFIGTPKGILILSIFLHFIVGGKIEVNPKTLTISNETNGIIGTLLEHSSKENFSKILNELQIDLKPFNNISIDTTSPDMEMKYDKNIKEQKTQ